ncbi:MAG: hypothetical protein Q8P41_18280 [Pseudomonadota bacterium]|nr:hypothetical protein [Pseudomonadota bacterium]
MSRTSNTPLLLGAGAFGLLILAAAASSPSARRTARQLEEKVESLITDWIPTLLRKTSEHEGNYWSVQPNLDGNGVSYGILQWTQKSGSLGRVLRAMAAADPVAFGRFFGASWAKLLDVTGRASLESVDGAVLWAEPWVSRFVAAGRWPAFQQVQARDAAESEYMASAIEIARLLGVSSERAMVLCYNRTVHQGPAGALGPAKRLVAWYAEDPKRRPDAANDVLAQYAWTCAAKFRRTSAPERRNYNDDGNIWWSPVPTEWSELGVGAYAVRRVAVSGVWHAVTGPPSKPWSLYDLIVKRSSNILTDPTLRDAAVDLGMRRRAA